jgi:uncharacterized protein HemX
VNTTGTLQTMKIALLVLALSAAVGMTGCSKKEPVKTADEIKAEKEAATKASRQNTVYGNQLQTHDKAKDLADQANKQAEEAKKKIDEQTK